MNLHKLLLVKNECYIAGQPMIPTGVMVHSTGARNTSLKRYVGPDDGLLGKNTAGNHWNQPRPDGIKKCVHAFVGKLKSGQIASYQTLPWDMKGWHAGGSANNGYIGFEICEDDLTHEDYFNLVYNEAIDLTVYLCDMFKLKYTSVICHSEGHDQGIASAHADVMHWFPKFGKSMRTFRLEVAAALGADVNTNKVKIAVGALNVRKGPSVTYPVIGVLKTDEVCNIVEIKNGWGKIENSIGWICLAYTKNA